MQMLLNDVRFAVRSLLRSPGFAAIVIVSIALGFAANATVFSIANGLLWGVLPVRDPGRLVMFSEGESFSFPDYADYRDQSAHLFDGGVAAHFPIIPASLGTQGQPERVWGQAVSGNFFPVLGQNMQLGRSILPADDQVLGRDHVIVLSNSLWHRRFNADPLALGSDIPVNGQHYTIIGVAPAAFTGIDRGLVADFWVPLAVVEQLVPEFGGSTAGRSQRTNQWLMLDARLRPGVSRTLAASQLNAIKTRLDDTYRNADKEHPPLTLQPAGGLIAGSASPAYTLMAVLMIVTALVLLVACANVANLLLARATGRQKEIAVRLALGARRSHLIRQLLIESLVLALVGAALGFALAAAAARALSSFRLPLPIPIVFDFNVDLRVAAFTLGLSVLTALLFGLVPALRASRPDLVDALKDGSSLLGRIGRGGLRNTLVIVQVAISLVLLTSAGLFLRSLGHASSIDLGFKPGNVLLMSFDPRLQNYSHERSTLFLSQLRARVTALPGVRSVSFIDIVPLSLGGTSNPFDVDSTGGRPAQSAQADVSNIGSGFFQTMSIPLLRGRDFDGHLDKADVAILNQTMANKLFPGQDPIGRTIRQDKATYRVIGVARNSKSRTIGEAAGNSAYLFLEPAPEKLAGFFGITLMAKTSGSPQSLARSVQAQIATLDPAMAVFNTETLAEHVDKSFLLPRVSALLLGTFGLVGLTLAAIGLYGVLSYSVRHRTREIGIRMALGAQRGGVLRMVFRQGLTLTFLGLAIGLSIAGVFGRFIATVLYGTSGTDAVTFGVVSVVLLITAAVAILVPATRAARLQPTTALRYE